MAGYIGTQAVSVNTTSATISDDLTVGDDVLLTSDAAVLKIGADADLQLTHSGSVGTITNGTGNLTLDVAGDIILDAAGEDIFFKANGTAFGQITTSSGDFHLLQPTSDKDIVFRGLDGSSYINALTLDMSDAGAATLNNGLTLTDGNLTVASGHGIDFAATSDGAGTDTSELLDDYEEGTWTPVFTAITNPTYSHQLGFYTKVGRKVTFHMVLIWTAGTSIGRNIGGLPYDVGNGDEYYFMSSTYHGTGTTYPTGRTTFVAYPVKGQTYLQTACNGSNIAAAAATFGTAGDLYVTGFYYIN